MQDFSLTDRHLHNIARKVGIPEFWVEDAAQEMRLAFWQRRERGSITYQERIAYNAAVDFVRALGGRKHRRPYVEYLEQDVVSKQDVESEALNRLALEQAVATINQMGQRTREAFAYMVSHRIPKRGSYEHLRFDGRRRLDHAKYT